MKRLLMLGSVVVLALASAGFGGGPGSPHSGLGSRRSSATGGAFGSSGGTPGTNSLGTALSSGRRGTARMKGPPLGTGNPAVDREDKRVARMVHSICRGC
jgi:hypothetical protein